MTSKLLPVEWDAFLVQVQKRLRHFREIRTIYPSGWYLLSRFCNQAPQKSPFSATPCLEFANNNNDLRRVKHNWRLSFF